MPKTASLMVRVMANVGFQRPPSFKNLAFALRTLELGSVGAMALSIHTSKRLNCC
jgi:hypothetical protein